MHSRAITMVKLRSGFALMNDTPYLAFTGELWGEGPFASSSNKNDRDISRAHWITLQQNSNWKLHRLIAKCDNKCGCLCHCVWQNNHIISIKNFVCIVTQNLPPCQTLTKMTITFSSLGRLIGWRELFGLLKHYSDHYHISYHTADF